MKEFYTMTVEQIGEISGKEIVVVESDIDLYYQMAFSLYDEIRLNNNYKRKTVCILPVGPVFQYRRFIELLNLWPLDLSQLHIFFMDEYLDEKGGWINQESPLSFRGFIDREFIIPMPEKMNLNKTQLHFPDPWHPEAYDKKITELGGISLCHAGVGIVGHLAFNEPISQANISAEEFSQLPTRVVELTRETITINSNTALRGAYEEIPLKAVTVGIKQILEAGKLRIYFNRPWQNAVWRKALMLDPRPDFPVTLAQSHPDVIYTMTEQIAELQDFVLK